MKKLLTTILSLGVAASAALAADGCNHSSKSC